jgi:hypothetical protein
MIRIHDLMTAFEGLSVPGIPFYADRALVLRGTAVVKAGPIDGHLRYLRDVDVGATDVIRLDSDDLVGGLAGANDARAAVLDLVRRGGRLQFFATTAKEERLLADLDLGWSHTFSAPLEVARQANDKAELRRMGERLDARRAFPWHRICGARDHGAVYAAVGELIRANDCDFVVLKRPDLASGDGMKLIERTRNWLDHVQPYLAEHAGAKELIVEAGYKHVPMSVQWELADDGPSFACATAQLIDEAFIHLGNVLSSGELPGVTEDDVASMRRISEPFVRRYWADGFRGVCGFDFLRTEKDGRVLMLECNGRVTATTYALGIGRAVAERSPDWAVVMSNVVAAPHVRGFDDVRRLLGRRLFDGTKGAVPFNLRCLSLAEPKVAVAAVGADVLEARIVLGEAKRLLA